MLVEMGVDMKDIEWVKVPSIVRIKASKVKTNIVDAKKVAAPENVPTKEDDRIKKDPTVRGIDNVPTKEDDPFVNDEVLRGIDQVLARTSHVLKKVDNDYGLKKNKSTDGK